MSNESLARKDAEERAMSEFYACGYTLAENVFCPNDAYTCHHNDPAQYDEREPDDDPAATCPGPRGHEWAYTGTLYGGDDERWGGEGRCYCVHCGADGDA